MARRKREQAYRNRIARTRGDKIFDATCAVVMVVLCMVVLYPIYFVVIASFSDPYYITTGQVVFLPKGLNLKAYQLLLQRSDVWIGYRNSICYTFFGTCLNMLVTLPAAYALSRRELAGRRWIMLYFTFTMFFNGGTIPTYILIRDLKFINTPWALLLPGVVNVFNLIIARTFFESTIPDAMVEAATIDGASNLKIFLSIVLPLSPAIIAVLLLYYGLAHWNSYFNAMIYISDQNLQTLQVIIKNIMAAIDATTTEGLSAEVIAERVKTKELVKYAVVVVSTIPALAIFPFVQKYFIKGVMVGAIKG